MQKAKRSEIVHTSASKPKGDARDCIRHHTVKGTNKNKREKYFPVAIVVDPPPNKMLKIAPTTTNPDPFIMDIPLLQIAVSTLNGVYQSGYLSNGSCNTDHLQAKSACFN